MRDVCPAKSRFLPHRTQPATRRHTARRWGPHTHSIPLPGSVLQFPGCFHSPAWRRTKRLRDQEWGSLLPSRPGKVMAPHPTPTPSGKRVRGPQPWARSPAWRTTAFPPIRNTNRSPGLPHPAQGVVPNISQAFPAPHLALGVTDAWETALCECWVQGAACRPRAS